MTTADVNRVPPCTTLWPTTSTSSAMADHRRGERIAVKEPTVSLEILGEQYRVVGAEEAEFQARGTGIDDKYSHRSRSSTDSRSSR